MTSKAIYKQVPYFYIIHHKPSGKMYAGAKWGKDAHPDKFMKSSGYLTSSKKVEELIEKDGID
jgi:hypothetical protein